MYIRSGELVIILGVKEVFEKKQTRESQVSDWIPDHSGRDHSGADH